MPDPTLRPRLDTVTTRLSIRPLAARDFAAWHTANAEHPPPDSLFDRGPRPLAELTRKALRSMVDRYRKMRRNDCFYSFSLFDRSEQTLIGAVSLQIIARIHLQLAWIGWGIFGQHRRKGYAREGVDAVIRLAFRELALHRLEAGIEPANHPSIRLARSLGLEKQASHKKCLFLRGTWVDLDVFATNAEDWGVQVVPSVGLDLAIPRRIETP